MNATEIKSNYGFKFGFKNPVKIKLIISTIFLSVLAVAFNAFFTEASIKKLYIEINISEYRVFGKELQRKIERGLFFGKKLSNYVGMNEILLNEKKQIIAGFDDKKLYQRNDINRKIVNNHIVISIAELDGTILYSEESSLVGTKLPELVLATYSGEKKTSKSKISDFIKHHDLYYTYYTIKDRDQKPTGYISISLKEGLINSFLSDMLTDNSVINISISFLSVVALLGFLSIIPMEQKRFSKRKISFIIFSIICSAQIISAGIITFNFKDNFLAINKSNAESLSRIIQDDVQYLLDKGIAINKLFKIEAYLNRIIKDTHELNDITLYDHNDYPLYRATDSDAIDFHKSKDAYKQWMEATKPLSSLEYNTRSDLYCKNSYKGHISTNASQSIIIKKVVDIAVGSVTVLIISILFLVEMLILFFRYLERGIIEVRIENSTRSIHYSLMRPAVFLLLFGVDISISFIPLQMHELYTPLLGLPKETIVGLPISVEFMFVGLAILISGVWLDRRGWHEPFIFGLLCASVGYIYSGLATDAINFIISRGIVGLGYGLALMASQGFVIHYSDDNNKAQGLANLFAGIYAGSICGGATGAMMAEKLGYSFTFMVGAVILLIVIGYSFLFMRSAMEKPLCPKISKTVTDLKIEKPFKNVFKFLSNRIVISLIFFSSLPAAIAVVGFMNYFMPVYLNQLGIPQSSIGQVLMLYGICLIYIGPFISRYVDSTHDKKRYVFLGCLLGSGAFLCFYFFDGIISAIIAIMMLGLSSTFVLASQSVYALKLKVTKKLGEGKAIGIFRSTSRVGQMLGPFTFSWLFATADVNKGIMYFGIVYLMTAVLFILFTQKDYKNLVAEHAK
jgi:predicted MFS family arabinose efflux permease